MIERDWGELSENYLIAFCLQIDCMSMPNLASFALKFSEKHCLDMKGRQTDGETWRK